MELKCLDLLWLNAELSSEKHSVFKPDFRPISGETTRLLVARIASRDATALRDAIQIAHPPNDTEKFFASDAKSP